jgi:hypothetical protein
MSAKEFLPDTPGRATYRRARWEAICLAALMRRNRGPARLVDGEWVYGLTLAECAKAVDLRMRDLAMEYGATSTEADQMAQGRN